MGVCVCLYVELVSQTDVPFGLADTYVPYYRQISQLKVILLVL